MAQISYLWDNPGTGDSPALGYGNELLCQAVFRMLFNATGNRGVLHGWLNDLEVTDGGGLNADVDTGGAFCYGVWFESDAAETVALAPNAAQTIIVRANWATQTARLAATSAALVQTPGATYEIPLATLTTNGAGITAGPTDARDYCTLPADPWPFGVQEDNLAADAATIAKVANQGRWLTMGAGAFVPDVTNPAVWASHIPYTIAQADYWDFADAATSGGWIGFRVPADFAGGNVTVYAYTGRTLLAAGDVRWTYNALISSDGVPFPVAVSGAVLQSWTAAEFTYSGLVRELSLCALPVAAGDIVLLQISRTGGHGDDTLAETAHLFLVKLQYTADS